MQYQGMLLVVFGVTLVICLPLSCVSQVFKDKGGDRKQKQDQLKIEKLSPSERVSEHDLL